MYIFTLKDRNKTKNLLVGYIHAIRGSNNFLSGKIYQGMSPSTWVVYLLVLVVKSIWEGFKK